MSISVHVDIPNDCIGCYVGGIPELTVFEKNGLKVIFSFHQPEPANTAVLTITLKASNSNFVPITDFVFQAAVPKVMISSLLIEVTGCFSD